ncbi:anther-specific proline-rich protein APG isoform X2 [Citrus clementina]|uniref:anther-specific proline-rich protein APG isoform X2 n=1 Tax=Citrus clementina TaxID=85681 RepID=UPI000CED2FC8|nr:anther-specific proline-rich protein APG isoform X2 [Citrus x clementina]
MSSKHLFIHITLVIVFLTFPHSSAQDGSQPDPAPPTDDNNKRQCTCPCPCPPSNHDNSPPSDINKPPQPPTDINKPPQPPSDTSKPPLPPNDGNKPPQPPSDTNKPPQPPNDSNKPPQPPSDTNKPSQPPNDNNKPPQPPSDSNMPPQPPSDINKPQQPPIDSNKLPQPPSDNNEPSQPPSDSNEPPQPPSDNNEPPQPPSDSNKPSQPPSDSNNPPQPPSDSNNPPQPPSDNQLPQPPSDNNEPSQPPSDSNEPPQPPSDNTEPSQPPSDNNELPPRPSDGNESPPFPLTPENNKQSPPLPPNESNENPPPSKPSNNDYEGCFSKVFAFGDSYTDTGNAYMMGGLQSFVGSLISSLPGHRNLYGHRQCDGRLVVDFLCETLAIPYLPPYKQASSNFSSGANFAVAGSTAFSHDLFAKSIGNLLMWKGIPLDFQVQIEWFRRFMREVACKGMSDSECKAEIENALFWVGEIGGSDYARTFGSSISHELLTKLTLGQISKIVKSLLDNGAKYIVVQGLPPLGCCPLEMFLSKAFDRDQMGCASTCNALVQSHNDNLQKMILEWQKQYPNCVIAYADFWRAFETILTHYKDYEFDEPFKACCGAGGPLNFNMHSLCGSIGTSTCTDPSRLMHWDGIHLTEAMYKHIADLFLNQGYCKPSFQELVKKKRGM